MQPAAPERLDHALLKNYVLDHAFDEMFAGPDDLHPHYEPVFNRFCSLPPGELQRRKQAAELSFLNQGITFTVYGRGDRSEHIFPYDLVPRIITADEWAKVERGLTQRITALNMFLKDIYNEGRILKDGVVPRELVYSCKHFRRQMVGLQVPNSRLKGDANLLIMPTLDAANISFNLLKTASGGGVTLGPMLLGVARPVHILTPSATVRRIVNMTALTVVDCSQRQAQLL